MLIGFFKSPHRVALKLAKGLNSLRSSNLQVNSCKRVTGLPCAGSRGRPGSTRRGYDYPEVPRLSDLVVRLCVDKY